MFSNPLMLKGLVILVVCVVSFIAILAMSGPALYAEAKHHYRLLRNRLARRRLRGAEVTPRPVIAVQYETAVAYVKLTSTNLEAAQKAPRETEAYVSGPGRLFGRLWATLFGAGATADPADARARRLERRETECVTARLLLSNLVGQLDDSQLATLAEYKSRAVYGGVITVEEVANFLREERSLLAASPHPAAGHLRREIDRFVPLYHARHAAAS